MQSQLDGNFNIILNYQDHFSKSLGAAIFTDGHIAPDTRLVKICWIILVIFTFVCSLSKQYSQSGDIYQFAQMGEFRIILVIDGSFW